MLQVGNTVSDPGVRGGKACQWHSCSLCQGGWWEDGNRSIRWFVVGSFGLFGGRKARLKKVNVLDSL